MFFALLLGLLFLPVVNSFVVKLPPRREAIIGRRASADELFERARQLREEARVLELELKADREKAIDTFFDASATESTTRVYADGLHRALEREFLENTRDSARKRKILTLERVEKVVGERGLERDEFKSPQAFWADIQEIARSERTKQKNWFQAPIPPSSPLKRASKTAFVRAFSAALYLIPLCPPVLSFCFLYIINFFRIPTSKLLRFSMKHVIVLECALCASQACLGAAAATVPARRLNQVLLATFAVFAIFGRPAKFVPVTAYLADKIGDAWIFPCTLPVKVKWPSPSTTTTTNKQHAHHPRETTSSNDEDNKPAPSG